MTFAKVLLDPKVFLRPTGIQRSRDIPRPKSILGFKSFFTSIVSIYKIITSTYNDNNNPNKECHS